MRPPLPHRSIRRALALAALRLARLASTISSTLQRFAERADPSLRAPEPPRDSGPGPETRRAQQLADEITLRRTLRRALRRYSPREITPQA